MLRFLREILTPRQREAIKNVARDIVYYSWRFLSPYRKSINPGDIRKVLVINLGVIGDLIVTTPMIKALAKKYHNIDVLMRSDMADILSGNSHINKLIFYTNFNDTLRQIKGRYQLAIIFSPHKYEIKKLCMDAGIKYTVCNSFSYSWSDIFLSQRTRENPNEHFVLKSLDMAKLAHADLKNPKTEFYFSRKDEDYVNRLLKKNKIDKFIVIHAGKRGNLQRFFWPSENWAEVIKYAAKKYKLKVILSGSVSERERNKEILSLSDPKYTFNFCEKTNLKQWACLIKKSKLLISLNTGATHIASAFNTKTIVLNEEFPENWHPWMRAENYRNLLFPEPAEVKNAVDELLKNT